MGCRERPVGPEGVLLTYRKRNLVKTTGEDLVFSPGEDLPVVEAGGLRVARLVPHRDGQRRRGGHELSRALANVLRRHTDR